MKNKNFVFVLLLAGTILFGLWGCSNKNPHSSKADRWPANVDDGYKEILDYESQAVGGFVEFPEKQSKDDRIAMWHWSEGADIYPLKWMIHLKSATFKGKSYFLEDLDKKYGLIRVPDKYNSNFVLPWVGITAAWSSVRSEYQGESSDVLLNRNREYSNLSTPIYKTKQASLESVIGKNQVDSPLVDGKVDSIAMVGTNCALCHTAEIKGAKDILDGAPGMFTAQGFFRDLFRSTATTLLKEDDLKEFLLANGLDEKKDKDKIKEIMDLNTDLIIEISKFGFGGTSKKFDFSEKIRLSDKLLSLEKKAVLATLKFFRGAETGMKELYESRNTINKMLKTILKHTYGIEKLSPELEKRMDWLTVAMAPDPKIKTIEPAWGRTDAFGRIGNLVARVDPAKPANLTANVSFPPMWSIKHKAMFHYSTNTNSVMVRNVGQSYGLGSVTVGVTKDGNPISTTDFVNLNKIEKELHKIPVPQWESLMSPVSASIDQLEDGCNAYATECMGCHQPKARVGRGEKKLVLDNLIPVKYEDPKLKGVGTDTTYFDEQKKLVGSKAFHEVLDQVTTNVADGYFATHGRDFASERASFFNEDSRGKPVVRGTFYGQKGCKDGTEDCYTDVDENQEQYPAPSLAGIWATAPYLHNGSVPTIDALLTKPDDRPKIFFTGSNEYLGDKLGFKYDQAKAYSMLSWYKYLGIKVQNIGGEPTDKQVCKAMPELCFDTSQTGNSNKGHDFGTDLSPEKKQNLIEFLKILRPQPEYAWRDSRHRYVIANPLANFENRQTRTCHFQRKGAPGQYEDVLAAQNKN